MYSKEKIKRIFVNTSDETKSFEGYELQKGSFLTKEFLKKENEFDLKNDTRYHLDGSILEEIENQKTNDDNFFSLLTKLYPVYKIENCLEYHYNKTKDKITFLKHIRYQILPFFEKEKTKIQIIEKWLKEKDYIVVKKEKLFRDTLKGKGKNIIEKLRPIFETRKPKEISYYLVALEEMKLIKRIDNITHLVEGLTNEFEKPFKRQAFNNYLSELGREEELEREKIEAHKDEITSMLK
ncbi:MAG: hypothetical protein ACK5QX_08075 [bacterium]|jgi:hypothetical protein